MVLLHFYCVMLDFHFKILKFILELQFFWMKKTIKIFSNIFFQNLPLMKYHSIKGISDVVYAKDDHKDNLQIKCDDFGIKMKISLSRLCETFEP